MSWNDAIGIWVCDICQEPFVSYGGEDRFCSRRCLRRASRHGVTERASITVQSRRQSITPAIDLRRSVYLPPKGSIALGLFYGSR